MPRIGPAKLKNSPAKAGGKVGTKTKPTAKTQALTSKYASFAQTTYDEPLSQSLILLILGQFGAGKTALAATASEYFPAKWPTTRHKGSKAKYDLKDMFWLSIDKKACAGFRERGVSVRQFDVLHFMGTEKLWREAGFVSPPNIFKAAEFGLKVAAASGATYLVVDTVTTLDRQFIEYWMAHCPTSARTGGKDTQSMYGEILNWHLRFSTEAIKATTSTIFICHTRVLGLAEKQEEKARQNTMTTAAGGIIIPDITGKGALPYKAHASAQLAVVGAPVVGAKGKLKRYVSTVLDGDSETKNRFELSLDPREVAHLGQLFKKIEG